MTQLDECHVSNSVMYGVQTRHSLGQLATLYLGGRAGNESQRFLQEGERGGNGLYLQQTQWNKRNGTSMKGGLAPHPLGLSISDLVMHSCLPSEGVKLFYPSDGPGEGHDAGHW